MITIAIWNLIHLAMFLSLGYVGYLLFKKFDGKIHARRMAAFDVSTMLSQHGLKRLPKILRAYATGDYIGAATEIRKFVEAVEAGVPVMEHEFDSVFDSVLAATLKTETGRILVKAKLDAATSAVSISPPAALAV